MKPVALSVSVIVSMMAICGTASRSLAQAPANNACSAAPLISVGSTVGTTLGSTNDGTTTCGVGASASPDVWYRFTASATPGTLVVDSCHPMTNFDTVVSLRSACPGSGSTLACNDDSGCATNPDASRVTRALTANQTVWIRVAGVSGQTGNFGLNVTYTTPTGGPDVTVGILTDVGYYGTNASGTISAYAVGTESCNVGDQPVAWYDTGTRAAEHPVIAQNMYRLLNGRFEQLGQSWLKHGFASTNTNLSYCGTCVQPPDGGQQLGVNCTDAYGSGLNGGQGFLGPRSEVNVTNGGFVWPHGTGSGTDGIQGSTIGMRLQVPTASVTGQGAGQPNFGAVYFVDAQYVTMDDARWIRPGDSAAINGLNNVSYQRININGGTAAPTLLGTVQRQKPGIQAWKDTDAAVTLVSADYNEPHPVVANGSIRSRFWVGAKATDLGGGMWHYEYAVYNLNSHRSASKFIIPLPAAAVASNIGFSAPLSHSGEPYSNTPWSSRRDGNTIVFETADFATNANANALRWGTMYNFRFDAPVAPQSASATLALFRPATQAGEPSSVSVGAIPVPTVPVPCLADFDGNGTLTPDDLADYIACYFTVPPCSGADFNADAAVDPDDLSDFISVFFAGC